MKNTTRLFGHRARIVLLTISSTAAMASGATISWEAAQPTTGAADLITGIPVFARNGGSASPVVGGVTFSSFNLGNGFTDDVYSGVGTITTTGDVAYDALIGSHTFGGGGATSNLPGAITGLTSGQSYQIQVWFNDERGPCCDGRIMRYGDGNGNNVDVAGGTAAGGQVDDYGQFAIGSFTADAATQTLTLAPANGFGNSHFNAILVTQIPEPSSALLLSLGGAFLFLRKRRK